MHQLESKKSQDRKCSRNRVFYLLKKQKRKFLDNRHFTANLQSRRGTATTVDNFVMNYAVNTYFWAKYTAVC
jgi:hypothetical protein